MRIVIVFATIFCGISLGSQAIANVSSMTETRTSQLCQIDSTFCN